MHKSVDPHTESLISEHTTRQLKEMVPGEFHSWANRKTWAKAHGVEWDSRLASFKDFLRHMGRKPSADATLDRITPTGPYLLENLRWADKHTQTHNRTNSLSVPAYGRRCSLAQIANYLGYSYQQIYGIFQASGEQELRRLLTHRKFELTFKIPDEWSELLEPQFLAHQGNLTRLDWMLTSAFERKHEILTSASHEKRTPTYGEILELERLQLALMFGETYRLWASHMEHEEAEGIACFLPEHGWELVPNKYPTLGDAEMMRRFGVKPEKFPLQFSSYALSAKQL